MSEYQTFVIRLWIEDDSSLRQGEVRHITTGNAMRFSKIEQALQFIERMAVGRPLSTARSNRDEPARPDTLVAFRPYRGETKD